jgi:hypothetical protein
MKNLNRFWKYGAGLALVALSGSAFATPTSDYQAIVDAVDWTDVITGVGAIAALIAAVLIVRKGSRMLLSFLK